MLKLKYRKSSYIGTYFISISSFIYALKNLKFTMCDSLGLCSSICLTTNDESFNKYTDITCIILPIL